MRFLAMRAVLCALLLSSLAYGNEARLSVEVIDGSGAIVPGARVRLSPVAGANVAETSVGPTGEATIEGLEQGPYLLEVSSEGLEPWSQRVQVGGSTAVTVELALATLTTTVRVEAESESVIALESISGDELAAEPSDDLVDQLRDIPGVNILRRGGTNFEPVLYGLRETQIAMVVDGTRTFAAGPARMDSELSHVDPGDLSNLTVTTGPYALTEGAGAFSAITVKTSEVPRLDSWRFGAKTTAGSSSNGSPRFGRVRVFGADRRFGFSVRGAGNKGNDYLPGNSRPAVQGDYSNHQLGGKLRFDPTDNQEINLASFYDEQTGVDYPGRLLTAEYFLLRSWSGSYLVKEPSEFVRAVKFGAYLNKKGHQMSNRGKPTARPLAGRRPPFALSISIPTESDTAGAFGWVYIEPATSWRLKFGFDVYALDQAAERFVSRQSNGFLIFSDTVWPDASINDEGFYASATRRGENGELSATLRFDAVQADAGRASDFYRVNTTGSLGQSEFNTSFSLAGRRRFAPGVSLGGGFGRVVRTANALERYSDRFPSTKFQVAAEFLGDPTLNPEVSYQGDLSLEVVMDGFSFSVGGFYRRISDYITVVPDPIVPKRLPLSPPAVFRYLNGDHANFRGYQFGLRYGILGLAEVRVQGAKVIADDIEAVNPRIGRNEPVLGIPPFEINSALRFFDRKRRFWGEYGVRNVWDQRRVSAARLETPSPGFTIHDIRFGANLPRDLVLHLGVENMWDKLYFEHINSLNPFRRTRIAEPGRNLYVALSKQW